MTAAALEAVTWAGPVDLPLAGELDVQAACGLMHLHGRRFGRPTRLGLDHASISAAELAGIGARAVELARARGIALRPATTSVAQAALLTVSQYLAAATAEGWPEPHEPGGPPFRSVEGVAFELEALHTEVWQRFWTMLGADPRTAALGRRPFLNRCATATCPLPADLFELTARTSIGVLEEVARRTATTLVRVASRAVDDLPAYLMTPLGDAPPLPPGGPLPLSGLVVLESCHRVRGPMAGHLLGLLGATVVRVEPPGGDPLRGVPPMVGGCSARFLALNRGKQVVEVDLGTGSGRRSLLELASVADVFLHDWAPRRAAAWASGPADLARVRPGIVYAHTSGWGDELGPQAPPGTDFLVQAHAGVPSTLVGVVDVFGGLVAARGVVDGLLRRARTGRGQSVETSLLSAASRLNARSRGRSAAPLTVPVCTDLAALARDPRFARALVREGCAFPASPWEFPR
ncbi:CoA transferase [Actinosynnema sp. NPDC023587]|uniref:CoA transferase n=1 Tax=Actinosynnema sp. NPDC023587 TaxID=3154695 RepID=UPI0033D57206